MIDQSDRTLLYILRSAQYLAWHYRESADGPKMRKLKRALIDAIAELEASGADLPALPMSRTVFTLQRSGEEHMAAAHLDRAAFP